MKRFEKGDDIIKYNPLIDWNDAQVDAYITEFSIPINPLHSKGFASIGCAPCTRAISPGEHPEMEDGGGKNSKKECGLHMNNHETDFS